MLYRGRNNGTQQSNSEATLFGLPQANPVQVGPSFSIGTRTIEGLWPLERAGGGEDHVACATHEVDPIAHYHAAAVVAINGPDTDYVAISYRQAAIDSKFVNIGRPWRKFQ